MSLEEIASALNTIGSPQSTPEQRTAAGNFLIELSGKLQTGQKYIELISSESVPENLRLATATQLKILITKNWNPGPDSPYPTISQVDKDQIKSVIIPLTLQADGTIFKLLSDCIRHMAREDFSRQWKELLPTLSEHLKSTDPYLILKTFKLLNGILKYYRTQGSSNEINRQLLEILDIIADPLRLLFEIYDNQIDANLHNGPVLAVLFQVIYLIFEIFRSLNSVDFPAEFEDHFPFWMASHRKFITFESTAADLQPQNDKPGLLAKVQASAIRNMTMFIQKYESDIVKYLSDLAKDVWLVINKVSNLPENVQSNYDKLVITSLEFITSAVSGYNHSLFSDISIIEGICSNLVLRNLDYSSALEECFECDPLEYIRLDIEGVNAFSRRRSAIDLIKGLMKHFQSVVSPVLISSIESLLSSYSANPQANWKCKDKAIYIAMALAVKSESRAKGAILLNPNFPVENFFEQAILPELRVASFSQEKLDESPVIKADCINFVHLFKSHLKKHYSEILSLLGDLLLSKSSVVMSYAALTIDSLITGRQIDNPKVLLLPPGLFEPVAPKILTNLFRVISQSANSSDNQINTFYSENQFVGTAIAHVLSCIRQSLSTNLQLADQCLKQVTNKIGLIYKNPSNPHFVHYMFDSIACVLAILIESGNSSATVAAEEQLTPAFNTILTEDIIDLVPYVFQIMAQLIEARKNQPQELVSRYGNHLGQFLNDSVWERLGNIPAVTRLIIAYIRFASDFVVQNNYLIKIFGIIKRLNYLRGREEYGFRILRAIMLYVDRSVWAENEARIYDLFFDRLRTNKTPGYVEHLLTFWSDLIVSKGTQYLINGMETVQRGILLPILNDIIIPTLPSLSTKSSHEIAVGMIKLWADPLLHAKPYIDIWPNFTVSINKLVCDHRISGAIYSDALFSLEELGGFTNEFSKLTYTGREDLSSIDPNIDLDQLWESQLNSAFTNPALSYLLSNIEGLRKK